MTDKEHISQLQAINVSQGQLIKELQEKVLFLLEQKQQQGVRKDSHNSSLPPSSDFYSKQKSLRTPSDKPSGGQLGHKGTTLEIKETPDEIIDLKSDFCSQCGQSLTNLPFTFLKKRQVVEIPPVVPIYLEYRQFCCSCPTCNHTQIADFPAGINAPIQYGNSVQAMISYFSVYQYVPFKRLQKLLAQVFSLPISQGSIDNILNQVALKCDTVYHQIKENIAKSPVVGSDETGAKVNGQKWWIWVWQTIQYTFIVASDNRGSKTVDEVWPEGLANSTMVSDRWAAQLKMVSKNKQICLAHLLRDIIFLKETEKHPFAIQFEKFIRDVFQIKRNQKETKIALANNSPEALLFEKTLNELLALTINENTSPKTVTFQNSIIKNRNYLLPCIYNVEIPPDNNGSERAIRTIKVKQKVSGQFKTGQNTFCVIRSVIDTLIKKNLDVMQTLSQIIAFKIPV